MKFDKVILEGKQDILNLANKHDVSVHFCNEPNDFYILLSCKYNSDVFESIDTGDKGIIDILLDIINKKYYNEFCEDDLYRVVRVRNYEDFIESQKLEVKKYGLAQYLIHDFKDFSEDTKIEWAGPQDFGIKEETWQEYRNRLRREKNSQKEKKFTNTLIQTNPPEVNGIEV